MFDTAEMYDEDGKITSIREKTVKLYVTVKKDGPDLHSIAQKFPHLKELLIDSYNDVNLGQFLNLSTDSTANLACLAKLFLCRGTIIQADFFRLFKRCPNLKELMLDCIEIMLGDAHPDADFSVPLTCLALKNSRMPFDTFHYLLQLCSGLQEMSIIRSHITGNFLEMSHNVISSLSTLKHLEMNFNNTDELERMLNMLPVLEKLNCYKIDEHWKTALLERRQFLAKKLLMLLPALGTEEEYLPRDEVSRKWVEELSAEVAREKWEGAVRFIQASDNAISRAGDWFVFFPASEQSLDSEAANRVGMDSNVEASGSQICIIA